MNNESIAYVTNTLILQDFYSIQLSEIRMLCAYEIKNTQNIKIKTPNNS